MAQIPVRLTTQGMSFPLLSSQAGRTVVDGRGDLTYVPGVSASSEIPEDRGVPGVFYAHNVMPSTYGWQAIGYEGRVRGLGPGHIFVQIIRVNTATIEEPEEQGDEDEDGPTTVPVSTGDRTYIAKVITLDDTSKARLFFIDKNDQWHVILNTPTFDADLEISIAYINGFTYLLIPTIGIYVFNSVTSELEERELNGIEIENVEGIFSSTGYLLLWTRRRIVWSASNNPEDFVPSDITGAGSAALQDAKGHIVHCTPAPLGFFAYTDVNVVSAVYTANEEFPFEFKEIPSAGGISSQALVSDEAAGGYFYAFTTNGIQRISHSNSNTVLTNISDFIGGKVFEDFNEETLEFSVTQIEETMPRAIAVVGNRYIIVSYAEQSGGHFTHAIVVDALQSRMGKLKIPHYAVFEYRPTESGEAADSRATIAFLRNNGQVSTVRFDLSCTETRGVLLMGKMQYVHQRMTQLQEVEVEDACPAGNFALYDLPSLRGNKLSEPEPGFLNPTDTGETLKRYYFNNVAKSHSLLLVGTFELITLLVWLNVHGRD